MEEKGPRHEASQETLISLLQLDPSPIETPPADTDKDLPPLPEDSQQDGDQSTLASSSTAKSGTSGSVGLSGSGHGALYYRTSPTPPDAVCLGSRSCSSSRPQSLTIYPCHIVSRIQRYSSYAFTIFASIHFATTSLVPLVTRSVPASETSLLLAREIYQTRISEPLLVAIPLVAHVGSGIAARLLRRSQNLRRYGGATPGVFALHKQRAAGLRPLRIWPRLGYISMSGYAFAVFLGAHIFVNRVLPIAVEGDSANISLAFVSHGFSRHGLLSWLAFVGLLAGGCGHMVWGWAKWLGLADKAGWIGDMPVTSGNKAVDKATRKRRRRVWMGINGFAALATLLWAAGGLGVVARAGPVQGWVGKLYDEMYDKLPLL
ncbi:uncharacterized protein E0L32_001160 [Thyridium curvatum]|uniref:Mitochondrial adapter protein MCP1 transmembrane domain-containing protein n=1 Tax=Thyridium curvatum TaxID=1093900 RepID=A0A507AN66_9PEZI|nr:uncharacterized protein E0L32_001160 [Thyridium curvatum]TPX11342.1 hypothetical protein E0L32_001160 [Thyridium curvatum]